MEKARRKAGESHLKATGALVLTSIEKSGNYGRARTNYSIIVLRQQLHKLVDHAS